MKKWTFIITALIVGTISPVLMAGDGEITTKDLLEEMVSLERLTRAFPEGTRMVQFSSYDRLSKIEDGERKFWWANFDLGHYYGNEKTGHGIEYVMAEAEGPGAIVRMWSANPGRRTWRIYIDGAKEPAIEATGKSLLCGKVEPWGPAFSARRNMGANFIFPITFSKSVKVTTSNGQSGGKAPLMYYQIDLRLYPEGTKVRPFKQSEIDSLHDEMEKVARILTSPDSIEVPEAKREVVEVNLAPGAEGELMRLAGPGEIVFFQADVKASDDNLASVLGKSLLKIQWDGEPTPSVLVPLGDFFGTSPGANDMASLPLSVIRTETGARLICRWVMPFQREAVISLSNHAKKRLSLRATVVVKPRAWDEDTLYFHAGWREATEIPTRPHSDMKLLGVKGRGHFVGLQMNVLNPLKYFWWGEGDEKIFVDDEEFPSVFGTGTEDYFGYAWCVQYFKFTHAYHGISLPTSELLAIAQALPIPFFWEWLSGLTPKKAAVSQYRWHFIDLIPFEKSFVFDMEIWHQKETEIDVNATAYWYASPGSEDDSIEPDLVKRQVWNAGQ